MTSRRTVAFGSFILGLMIAFSAFSSERSTVELLQQYVRLNTVNPPGMEIRGAQFFAAIFEQAGISYQIIESEAGRANIWAKLDGGDLPGVLLLHHMDVVPADPARWDYPPFQAQLVDGYIHGRGTLDNKSTGIFHLQAFLALHAAGKQLKRDVIFLATADEEAGGNLGVGWLTSHHPQLFDGVGGVLNEGGFGSLRDGKLSFGIELTQKLPLWLKITASGTPGHGAVPREDSAPKRLVRALTKLEKIRFQPKALPIATDYLRNIASLAPAPWDEHLLDADKIVASSTLLNELQSYDHRLYALLINTCSLTRLAGSGKINVVPPVAIAEVDCRLLPDETPEDVLALIKSELAGEGIAVETTLSFGPGSSSPDNFLYRALEKILTARYPNVPILPKMNAGFTDSHFFRERNIPAYGFTPLILTREESAGVHADNESISLDNLKSGSEFIRELLYLLVYD